MNRLLVAAGLVASSLCTAAFAQIPAFSGADGAARNVSGGRGGIVYHVTKLNSSIDDPQRNDPGTIRYGLNNANFPANTPRTIVFDVGGVFHLGRLDQPNAATEPWITNGNGWDAQSRLTIGGTNITIAGQTAPGRGVIFMGGGLKPQGTNNIIRNITVAAGYGMSGWWSPGNAMRAAPGTTAAGTDASQWYPDNVVYDAMDIAAANGLMIDHVSTLFGTDETISMNETAFNVTVQYSNISQGQNFPQWDAEGGGLTGHALGSLLSAGNTTTQAAVSFHHNLYAHLKGRTPQMQSIAGAQTAFYDFRNNVFYNWMGTAGTKSGNTSLNLVNNFYLAGKGGDNPIGGSTAGWTTTTGGTSVLGTSATVFRSGNLLDSNKDSDALDGVTLSAGGAASPLWMGGTATYTGVTDSATAAYDRVLNYMGANWWTRDNVIDTPDERIINETRTGTGKIIAWADDPWNSDPAEGAEWRSLLALRPDPITGAAPFNRPAGFDLDEDGMPGTWELKHGLNPLSADNNGDFDNDGYTNLEEYINELAEWPAPQPLTFNGTTNNRYAQITNWSLTWQPSKYDTAKINAGTVIVDAVGQHAGTLLVGFDAGSAGELAATAGWIETNVARVGSSSGSAGMITLGTTASTRGEVRVAGLLRVGNTGALNFAGGVLALGNAAIFDYTTASPIAPLTGEIVNGIIGPSGIKVSSESAAPNVGIGIAEASELGLTSFAGEAVDSTTVVMLVTYLGDSNLDRKVDFADLLSLAQHYGQSGTWTGGDFNYDGVVEFGDLLIVAQNYFAGTGSLVTQEQFEADLRMAFMLAPEPTSLAALTAAGPLLGRRRR